MQTVVLDTNALLMPFEMNINLTTSVERLIGEFKFVVPSPLIGELKHFGGKYANVALHLARRYEIVSTEASGDDSVIELAVRKNAFVLTNDKMLRNRLRSIGIPLIYLRSGTHLVVERV